MSEVENFEGKPNLTEVDFCALGQRFKFSIWFDATIMEGVAKIEQNGVLLARDDRMSRDMRKPIFDLEVYVDQQKHQLQIFVFGFLSLRIQCRVDDAVVFGPQKLPAYVSLIAPANAFLLRFLEEQVRKSKQEGETPHADVPTSPPPTKHEAKPSIKKMDMKDAVVSCLRNWNNFRGRACRTEFWCFYAVTTLIGWIIETIEIDTGMVDVSNDEIGILSTIYFLLLIPPLLSVTARRLHDRGWSGWWLLPAILISIGGLVLYASVWSSWWEVPAFYLSFVPLVVIHTLVALPATEDENKWGRNPLI